MSTEPSSVGRSSDTPDDYHDDAVDDSSDVDADFAMLQRSISQKRREEKESSAEPSLQKILPFAFSPNTRPLTISDLDACIALENAAFPHAEHRASPEKIKYRLTRCPELSLGVFCTVVPEEAKDFELDTLEMAKPVETDRQNKAVSVLLAHIISTRSSGHVITDNDMDYPKDWKDTHGRPASVGHQESGRTVAVHSLAVAPKLQGCGLGKLIVKSFLQQINDSGTANRVALICQDYLVSYYQRFGFKHLGRSTAEFGGGGWHDMVFDLAGPKQSSIGV